ncbi:MAG: Glu-tRNA(Gln) amidotransferase GatDE subunit D, partial [Methanomassiliicoccaceae archaeon]|nr:Glu-tRNA(Gln) amidotransferase GatDE subunit D [Methanomassiliicoccaceae archaeon]
PPVAFLDEAGAIRPTRAGRPPSAGETVAATGMEGSVALLQYYPGMDPSLFEGVIMKSKGVVIAGTGLGHVGEGMIPLIKRACDNGTVVVVTSQCIGGRTNLNVYSTGRDMISAGATAVLDMLPETAYVKLMWALANSEDAEGARRLMRTPLADEMGDRREVDV